MKRSHRDHLTTTLFITSLLVIVLILLFPHVSLAAEEKCFTCHGQPDFKGIVAGKTIPLYVDAKRYANSVHGSIACVDCHAGFKTGPHGEQAMVEYSKVASWACKRCHDGAYRDYTEGSHGKAYNEGKPKAPTCVSCHGSHYVAVFKDTRAPVSYLRAPKELCGKCHHEALETYLEGYHGKTLVVLGYEKSASCSKCHGAHLTKRLESTEEKIAACKPCHPDANENFVGYLVHADENDRVGEPLLFYVKWIMTSLLIGVFAFFYSHTVLWALRDTIERRKKRKRGEKQ